MLFVKRLLKILAVLFGLLILFWSVVIGLIATPEVLTPQIQSIAQQYIKSEISIKSVDLSLFTRFPNVTMRIDSLRITQTKDSISDLLFARECRIAIDPVAILFKNVVVNHFSLRDASLYVYVDEDNGPLKTFNLPDAEEQTEAADSLSSSSSFDASSYSLSLKRFKLDSIQLTIDDRTRKFYTRVDNYSADVSLNLSSSQSNLNVATAFSNLIVWNDGELLVKKTSMDLRSKMDFDMDSMKLSFDRARIKVNGIDLRTRGSLMKDSLSGGILVDMRSSLNTPSLTEFLALVPNSIIDGKDKITTQGSVSLDLEVKGLYSEESLPTVGASLKIEDAKAKYASRKLSLENVACDAYAFIDMNNPSSSYADIKSLEINTSEIINLNVSGKVRNMLDDPAVDMTIHSDIDFDRFTEVFPLNEAVVCSGTNVSDITTQFVLSDVMNSNYANLYIDGESVFSNLGISFDASKFVQDSTNMVYLYMQAETGKMLFGDNVRHDSNSRTLRSKMDFSGLGYKAKTGEFVTIKDIEITMGANFDRESSAINGMGVKGIAKDMNVGIDSLVSASLVSSEVNLIINPKNESRENRIRATIGSKQITVSEPSFSSEIALSSVDMDVTLQQYSEEELQEIKEQEEVKRAAQRQQQRQGPQRQGQGPQGAQGQRQGGQGGQGGQGQNQGAVPQRQDQGQRDSLQTRDPNRAPQRNTPQLESLSDEPQQKWRMNGTVAFADLEMITSLFPLPISVPKTSVTVSPGVIQLDNAMMKIGSSRIIATGQVSNLLRKMFIEPRASMSGELAIKAPYVDFSELLEASNQSILMLEQLEATDSLSTEVTLAQGATPQAEPTPQGEAAPQGDTTLMAARDRAAAPTHEASALFLVPRRMDFAFDLNIDKALFEQATIENVEGYATIQDGAITLERLSLKTIGADATGSVIYKNSNRTSATVAATMNLVGVDINRIGELLPEIITMFPMLESFEGNVDFDFKVNTALQSSGDLDISTLRSAMMFKGTELVLMDSETFADLSKTLMFKNKDRNLIESLEAYALVDENTVDVLPFLMEIDRYQAIIGGSQDIDPATFDLDYKYNVSIIKSPLPFKAGVDITGNLEDFKFKVTTAKLKNTDFDEQRKIYEEYRDSIE